MARMMKTSLERGTVLWSGVCKNPASRHSYLTEGEQIYYYISLISGHARSSGCTIYDGVPVPFLRSLGIKVEEQQRRDSTLKSWRVIGCSYQEIRASRWVAENYIIKPEVQEFYNLQNISNEELNEAMIPIEVIPTAENLRAMLTIGEPQQLAEEGWIAL